MKLYSINQRVVFLREPGGGRIISVEDKGFYQVEDADGFTVKVHNSELAPVHGDEYDLSNVHDVSKEKEIIELSRKSLPKNEPKCWEIDLHIEELVDSHANWSNTEILNRQLSAFRAFYVKARKNRVKRIVIIHGVGEGVLKCEVRNWLNQQEGLSYEDADFREYGQGATLVELYYF